MGSALTITRPNAAGIEIGGASHFIAVPPDRDASKRSACFAALTSIAACCCAARTTTFSTSRRPEERYRERVMRALSQRADKLGMQRVPPAQPA